MKGRHINGSAQALPLESPGEKSVFMTVDPRTPVIVGVGQAAERIGDPGYRAMSAAELAAAAAQAALDDCTVPGVADAIDIAAGIRQFENSSPYSSAPLGKSTNYPRSVARRVGAEPQRAILDVVGGQGPQRLLTELAGAIAAGDAEVALLFGSDATSTTRHFCEADAKPNFSETVDGQLEDPG